MDKSQKVIFVNFFREFQDIIFEQIVAGNCDVLRHEIKLQDSSQIKQIPKEISISMHTEVEITREIKNQEVIEESFSP